MARLLGHSHHCSCTVEAVWFLLACCGCACLLVFCLRLKRWHVWCLRIVTAGSRDRQSLNCYTHSIVVENSMNGKSCGLKHNHVFNKPYHVPHILFTESFVTERLVTESWGLLLAPPPYFSVISPTMFPTYWFTCLCMSLDFRNTTRTLGLVLSHAISSKSLCLKLPQ